MTPEQRADMDRFLEGPQEPSSRAARLERLKAAQIAGGEIR
jgi:hypothetical protein